MTNLLEEHGIELWKPSKIAAFRKALLDWYDQNKRDLPWRRTQDPYAIWVSEIMLQQTQVVTVIPYFERFMTLFPTIASLANADQAILLKAWEGLGYYSRARNLQSAAQQIMTDFNGKMPENLKDIASLKGIGPYTAGAIASIAFQIPAPAVDGNIMRVMARLFEIKLDIAQPKNRKVFEALVEELIDPDRPGDFNQALMDLGSDICSAQNPKPEISPIKAFNAAYQNGTMDIYPIKSKAKKATPVYYTALVYQRADGAYFMQQRSEKGLLAKMWQFPLFERQGPSAILAEDQALYESALPKDKAPQALGTVTHLFSHLKWHIDLLVMPQDSQPQTDGQWVHPKDFGDYPMPTPQLKLLKLLEDKTKKGS